MKIELSKKHTLTIETFCNRANGGKPFTGVRFRLGKLKPKTLFHFHHSKLLPLIDALKECIGEIEIEENSGFFYETPAWARLRYQTLKRDRQCVLCGSTKDLQCDHIQPRSKFPHLALNPDNLQTLCKSCNLAKSNLDSEDFR